MLTKKEAVRREINAGLARRGWKDRDGAKLIGVHQTTYSDKKRGKSDFTLNELIQLDKVLGTEIINPALMDKYKKVF